MYIPAHFVNDESEEVHSFIRENSFAILITSGDVIHASHIPLDLSPDGKRLSGHLSKANGQARTMTDGELSLSVFNGPHTYISSSWYDHENVPTWNYIAVHVKGRIKMIEGDELVQRLSTMVEKYEANSQNPVSVQDMSRDYLTKHLNGIIGFDIDIESIEAAYKLSQNRTKANHDNIVRQLEMRGDHHSSSIAFEMKKRAPEK